MKESSSPADETEEEDEIEMRHWKAEKVVKSKDVVLGGRRA